MLNTIQPRAGFHHISLLPCCLRLTFGAPCAVFGTIDVFVRGILVSSTPAARSFQVGEHLALPINYFPCVQLPAYLRICVGDEEIAAPVEMKSAEEVMALVGQGDIEAANLCLEAGLLRGTFALRGNTVSVPSSFVRINGVVIRSVVVEPPVAQDTGGAACRFAVPIRPADFVESGLSVDVHISGIDYPLANFTYARADPSEALARLVKLEEELRQAQKANASQIEMISATFQRHLTVHQERIDAFIEYAMSILVDNLAGAFEMKSDPAVFLRALVDARLHTAGPKVTEIHSQAIRNIEVKIESDNCAFGWYDLEVNEHGPFRWMGQTALITNPYPDLPISSLEFLVSQVYGAREPQLHAIVEDVEFNAITTAWEGSFLVRFSAPSDGEGVYGQSVRVESFQTGCPAIDEGTSDTRTLSVALQKINFYYRRAKAGASERA